MSFRVGQVVVVRMTYGYESLPVLLGGVVQVDLDELVVRCVLVCAEYAYGALVCDVLRINVYYIRLGGITQPPLMSIHKSKRKSTNKRF